MLRSMTGFASHTTLLSTDSGEKIQVTLSIKSLNSRFFETTFKMPHIISSLEVPLTKKLKKDLLRGHIYFTLYLSDTSPFKGEVEPALSVCKGYAQAIEKIKHNITLEGNLSVSDLMAIPHVFTVQEKGLDEATKETLLAIVNNTINTLIAEQTKEGALLLKDISERIAIMQSEIARIAERSAQHVADFKEKISKEIPNIEQVDPASDARKSALYMTLDKIDIHEETVRFKSHLANLRDLIKSTTLEKGKRVDFTLQELSREINTIAAKASNAEISTMAVNIKVELEKAREQAQNIV